MPATLDSLAAIGAYVRGAAAAAGLERRAAYKLRLAIDEVATNIITHGYGRAGAQGQIEVRARVSPGELAVVVEDTAPPFDPTAQAPPDDLGLPPERRRIGGLGIFLALDGVDRFTHEYSGGRNRNTLIVERRPPAGDPRGGDPAQ